MSQLQYIGQQSVRDAVEFDDGTGPALYVCGQFESSTGDTPLRRIAKWTGKTWEDVGGGMTKETGAANVYALAVHDDGQGGGPALYAAGSFTHAGGMPANNIAKWDGKAWSSIGDGLAGTVYDMLSSDILGGPAVLIAGGNGAVNTWNGQSWATLGTIAGYVNTFEIHDDGNGDALYIGGFLGGGWSLATTVMKWTGSAWDSVGTGFAYPNITNPSVWDLISFNDGSGNHLYAGGTFIKIENTDCYYIARWNGQAWLPMGLGFDGTIEQFAIFDDGTGSGPQLFAGGFVESFASVPDTWTHVHGLAKWTGTTWTSAGNGNRSVLD